jgi:vanadium-dependent haloperoxidase-like protein/uncharacterized protein DUF6851
MKYKLATTLLVVAGLCVATLSVATSARPAQAATGAFPVNGCPEDPNKPPPCNDDDAVVLWNDQLLDVIRAYPAQTGPTITARALGVLHTATYDAWAAYDPTAKVTRPDGPAQQQATRNTLANKSEAISYAAYRVLIDLFPPGSFPSTGAYQTPDVLLTTLGYSTANTTPASTTDTAATAAGVGNLAAQAVLNFRHGDGSNQLNNYGDTTGYKPVNTWNTLTPNSNPLLDGKWRWQPLCVLTAAGLANGSPPVRDPSSTCPDTPPVTDPPTPPNYTVQKALTPQWGNVTPFSAGLASTLPYLVPGPPKNSNGTYSTTDIATALADTSNLSDASKSKAEYWADGPKSEFPPGHMGVFAQFLCRKKGNNLDNDTKLFFMLGNAMMDASIASWWYKYKYDFVRPVSAIREFYKNNPDGIISWLGPNKGFGKVPSQQWMPYQALTVVTPGFPEYVSGHSTFSAAGATLLSMANGGDTFGASITIKKGSSKIEPGGKVPAADVTLSWPMFTDATNEAGMSRRYGGIHFYSGDIHGRAVGRQVAQYVYSQAQNYIKGYAGK